MSSFRVWVFIVERPRVEPMDLDCSSESVEGAMQSPEEEMGRDKPSGANAANHNHYSSKFPLVYLQIGWRKKFLRTKTSLIVRNFALLPLQ